MRSPDGLYELHGMDIWESPNPDYSLLSKVVIDKGQRRLLAAEPCEDDDCNWGWTKLEASHGGYLARYKSAGVTYELFVREVSRDEIQLFITSATAEQTRTLLSLDRLQRQ